MATEFHWTIPTRGDGRSGDPAQRHRGEWGPGGAVLHESVTDDRPGRFTPFDHTVRVARAAEAAGFDGVLIPYDPEGEESWVLASALGRETPRLQLVTEFQPGFATAVYTAKLALSFQRFFQDRQGWKLALGTDEAQQRRLGDDVRGDDRLRRARELLEVTRGVWAGPPFEFSGEYFEVEGGGFFDPTGGGSGLPGQTIERRPHPVVYSDGVSDSALEFAAASADVHVFESLPPQGLATAIDDLLARASAHGRSIRVALRLAIVTREFEHEAVRRAERLFADVGAVYEPGRGSVDGGPEVGFSAFGLGTDLGLVGDHEQVAAALGDLAASGVDTFVLDGLPRLEEAYRVGQQVLPLVAQLGGTPERGALAHVH